MTFLTYLHQTKDTGRIFYIGKGNHKRVSDKNNRNKYWKNIVNKHGFTASVIAQWETEKDAFEHEKVLIACFKDMGYKLANILDGGPGGLGSKSEETKKRISKAKKGVPNFLFRGENNPSKRQEIRKKRSDFMKAFYANGGVSPLLGKKRLDLSARNKLSVRSGALNHKSRPVIVNDVLYASIRLASIATGISDSLIRWRAINNPHKFSTFFPGGVTN
jgi:hypothetical protein